MATWQVILLIAVVLGLIVSPVLLLRDTAHLRYPGQANTGPDQKAPSQEGASTTSQGK